MTLSRDLSNQAKAYAQKIANMGQLMHSSQAERGESVGENLAYACSTNGTPLTGESATKMWYVITKKCRKHIMSNQKKASMKGKKQGKQLNQELYLEVIFVKRKLCLNAAGIK